MTDEQHAALTRPVGFGVYVRDLADQMGLRDWMLVLANEPADDGCNASMTTVFGRKVGELRIGAPFFGHDAATQRQTLVHELLHCHLSTPEAVIESVEHAAGNSAYSVLAHVHHWAVEHVCDALAEVIAPFMPLPAWTQEQIA